MMHKSIWLLFFTTSTTFATNILYGSCPINPCVVYSNLTQVNYTTTSVLQIQNANIQSINEFPQNVTQIDLSWNNISSITSYKVPSILSLNLSHNQISTLDTVPVLPTLTSLDLSDNKLTGASLSRLSAFPNLNNISLRNNNIKVIHNPIFPPNLQTLDLSGNPIVQFDISMTMFILLSNVSNLDLGSLSISNCFGTLQMLGHSVVCITDAPLNTAFWSNIYGPVILVFFGVLLLALAYLVMMKCLRGGNDQRNDPLRDTCVSSNYSRIDDDPAEYRISLSFDMDTSQYNQALNQPDVAQYKLHLSDIRKRKLITANSAYTTYAAQHQITNVDIKVLTACNATEDTLLHLRDLVHEITMLARLNHPNIVSLI
ncbi:hypothetical protein THRCLA_09507, partial [Thraustotheca clavata]